MPRSFDATIPPEYKIMSTQVTQYGEPVTAQITPSAYGSYGRAPQDPNDMHQAGMGPEVWQKGQSPYITAQNRVAADVAYLKNLTRTGQINTPEITEREGGAKVTYHETTRDQQVSNVRGLQITGDPQTVGRALKSAGSAAFEGKMPLDAPRAKASMHRAVRSMPAEHREAFQEVLARKGPEAFESMAPTALAGLNIENVGATPSGFVMPKNPPTQLPQQRRQTTAKKVRPMVRLPSQQTRSMAPIGGGGKRGGSTLADQVPTNPNVGGGKRGSTIKAKVPTRVVRPKLVAPGSKPSRAATFVAVKAAQPRDEGSHPEAFDRLVADASAKQENGASKGMAKFHPAQSNFQDPTGQSKAPTVRTGVRPTSTAKQVKQLKVIAKKLSDAQEKTEQKAISTTKTVELKKQQANQAQAQGDSKKASMLLAEVQKLQQTLAELRKQQNQIKQNVTTIQQDVLKASASGDISQQEKQQIIVQLPSTSTQPIPVGAGGGLPGMASTEDTWVDDDGSAANLTSFDYDFTDTGMKTSTKLFIGGGIAAALGLGVYIFAR